MSSHSLIPVGATLKGRWYEVEHNLRFPVDTEGWEDACRTINERYAAGWPDWACVVDLVWDLRWEPTEENRTCGQTGMIDRTQVRHLDDAHWDLVRGWAPPLPAGMAEVRVVDLHKRCAFDPMRGGRRGIATSDLCGKPATSAHERPDGARTWRCEEHKGAATLLERGYVRLRVLVRADEVDPRLHLRTGPL